MSGDTVERFDFVVIGSGPAGQKAAVCAAKHGKRVLLVEREREVGGACVMHGTIPSKTLREAALNLSRLRGVGYASGALPERAAFDIAAVMEPVRHVLAAHHHFMADQLSRNGVDVRHARARFVSPTEVEVQGISGERTRVTAGAFIVATGSRPRHPDHIPVDHDSILDSDSILSLAYLPESLTVIGSGVIACEYASIFTALGVQVVMVDRWPRPVGFLDAELTERFVKAFEEAGGVYMGGETVERVEFDGVCQVRTRIGGDRELRTEKALCALGRSANVHGLGLEEIGVALDVEGLIPVDEGCQTSVRGIYAVGDVSGFPALTSSAMEQGRRAVRHALGLEVHTMTDTIPVGVYTIPEMASVGLDEDRARTKGVEVLVGRAPFSETARGQIAGLQDGLLKLVAAPDGRVLGVQIIGEGAAELIHLGQMALQYGATVDTFVESIFNFPTLAEAYRIAALDITNAM
ncbi:MAG: Si-specific NAD(P)(+) transhydrogenase [Myxococcota bacterium]